MAQDEVYAGPVSESIPSSVASFVRRQHRRDSSLSFTYFQESNETPQWSDEEAVEAEEEEEEEEGGGYGEVEYLEDENDFGIPPSPDRDFHRSISPDVPLLQRLPSRTDSTSRRFGETTSQKVYIATEDLTVMITGFSTSAAGFAVYLAICLLSCGLGYLLLRWLPRWRVKLIGRPTPFHSCQWVAIENQWGQFTIHQVTKQPYGHPLSTIFPSLGKEVESVGFDDDDDPILQNIRFLDYRYVRFYYHPYQYKFLSLNAWRDPAWTSVKELRSGLDAEERDLREQVFGPNIIDIHQKTIPQILVDEAFHPFYIFQVASLILWSLDQYYYYAACIFFISSFSIAATVFETRSTMRRLREISHFECDVRVLRSGFWRYILSTELVPGDVYEISDPSLQQVPCDSLLLAGDCIVNESMLTGESVPISKFPATQEALDSLNLSTTSMQPNVAKHFLFCGTKIIRARRPQDLEDDEAAALAMVVRIGFDTTKGALVRSMLFPKPSGFKFYRDSFRYISVMGAVASLGFLASFLNFVHLGLPWHTIIVRALDLITIVVPPALPATLTIGTNFALSRLKKQEIFCISPQRVNVAGKLDVVCFDKTGTLTEDGLDVLGVRLVHGADRRFTDLLPQASEILSLPPCQDPTIDYRFNKWVIFTMATCHSLSIVDNELIGDPLDLKMFQFTGWSFEEGSQNANIGAEHDYLSPSIVRPPPDFVTSDIFESHCPINELHVLKSFEFVSQLRRSSVVVRQPGVPSVSIFVKGAPESLRDICVPDSLPPDFDELLSYYTHRGYRVIACAAKRVQELSSFQIHNMHRTEAEFDLEFIGFVIFENKLKPSTEGVISELNQAGIRSIMCTGDNILTAISVARECGLINSLNPCFVPRFIEGNVLDPKSHLVWESCDNPAYQLDETTLTPISPPAAIDMSIPYHNYNSGNYSVAVSGDIFRWIVDYGSEDLVNRMLVCGQVYARMSPDEKHELVEKLQSLDYCCGFCGDGANDCGALKAADVGISLSEAEASVAAPFTSRVFDISCVPKLIREGRAALVTSFCCFKYMSLYSAIQFTSVSFLYSSASNLGDFQFLYIDLALILPIAIFMGWIGPSSVLYQKRPTASLVSRKVLTPLLGQIALCFFIQLCTLELVRQQEWYKPPRLNLDDTNIENSENTALFLVSCYQYILSGLVLSVGRPFRQPAASNLPFVVTITLTLLFSTYMVFDSPAWLFKLMQFTEISTLFGGWIIGLALVGFVMAYVSERRVFPKLARAIGHVYIRFRPSQAKQRRRYKLLQEDMRR
ncbi:hypothetical protein AJ80_05056 [Polytolypa hystricis UAMH7299]|uniref:Cation-transporting ATPase n=1 Tax=Polytolypa hystricis (strain UAMH7299) TaxID=1447883 RepID=A0A2B7Y7Q9_POLH7|nr:hypothetical protein AJ80_05056 [Polytolypa hystricis UAMH7299]